MHYTRIVLVLAAMALTPPAFAQIFDFDFKGSLGEGRFQRYVAPLANPLLNETPYITTELRAIYFHQKIPDDFLTNGGHINAVAAEIRIALTERLGFIASKDGYAEIEFDEALPDESGFANISLGLKYALVNDPQNETIVTAGVEYEPPTGTLRTAGIGLQGDGDGLVDLFVTGATLYDKLGVQGSAGFNLAVDDDHDSSMFHYSLHLDYEAAQNFYPLVELNGFTAIDEGDRTPIDSEGVDLVNFGATDSGTVVTGAVGARYRVNNNIQIGVGYEKSLTNRQDILDWRAYFDLVLSY